LAVTDSRLRRWRLWFLALMTATHFLLLQPKIFAAATKRFVGRTKDLLLEQNILAISILTNNFVDNKPFNSVNDVVVSQSRFGG